CNGAEIAAACDYRRRWRGPEPGRRDVTIIVQTAGANQLALIAWGLAGVPPITMGIGPVPATADAMRRAGLRLADDARGPLPTSMPSRSMCCVRMNRTDVAVSGPQLLAVASARVAPGSTDRGRADGGCRGGEQWAGVSAALVLLGISYRAGLVEVLDHDTFGLDGVAFREGLHQRAVVFEETFRVRRFVPQRCSQRHRMVAPHRVEVVGEQCRPTRTRDEVVESSAVLSKILDTTRLEVAQHLLVQLAQGRQFVIRDPLGGQPRAKSLDSAAQEVELEHRLPAQFGDRKSVVRPIRDQPFAFQPTQCLAYGSDRDAKPSGDLVLRYWGAGRQLAADDLLA